MRDSNYFIKNSKNTENFPEFSKFFSGQRLGEVQDIVVTRVGLGKPYKTPSSDEEGSNITYKKKITPQSGRSVTGLSVPSKFILFFYKVT
jgi:hypothetical protein